MCQSHIQKYCLKLLSTKINHFKLIELKNIFKAQSEIRNAWTLLDQHRIKNLSP